MPDPLAPVRQAKEALDRVALDYEQAHDRAAKALADACRNARDRDHVQPKAIIEASGLKPSTFYALIGPKP